MSSNSSSLTNASLPSSPLSSSFSIYYLLLSCSRSSLGRIQITAFTIFSILILLPFCILVLYHGFQRWRQQRSSVTKSYSDLFVFHMVVTELTGILGTALTCLGSHTDLPQMMMVGIYLFFMKLSGQMLLHLLTCVERYLAVVHPITYRSLRRAKGITITNVTIGCVWLMCFALVVLLSVAGEVSLILSVFILSFALIVVSFCSCSVLCALIRPGPGDGGEGRRQVDRSKLRAFYSITAILGTLLIRFGGSILIAALHYLVGEAESCGVWLSVMWWSVPSSLVSPLLFLQRAGKLTCCKSNNTSGQGAD